MSQNLVEEDAQIFDTFVAKLLFFSKRSRLDKLTEVSLLTTRVWEPYKVDENKFIRVLQ